MGVDFIDTFSPVAMPTTIRIILTLTGRFNWPLRQLDVNNAFLNNKLKEEVYMHQPQGFVDRDHLHYVCRLHKSLYELKQALQA